MNNKFNPDGFAVNGRSFNEYAIAEKTLENWIKYGKEKYKGTPFFGKRDDAEQTALLTKVHELATEKVKKQEETAEVAEQPTVATPIPEFTAGTMDNTGGDKPKKPNKN